MEPLPVFSLGRVAACLALFACVATGQPAPPPEPAPVTTVVTVTSQALPVSAVPASVTVLTRDYIETSHAENAADLLRSTPFLTIAQTGASGGMTTVRVRGAEDNFTLIMIDGIAVNDITTLLGGSFDLTTLPVDNIEQVEIVRGPLSSVYGSDAIGGVINFISRKGAKKSLIEASGELGNFLRRQFRVSASGTWKALKYSIGGSRLDVGEQVLNDGFSVTSLSAAGSVALGQHTVLDFTARYLEDQSGGFPTASGGPELALNRQPLRDEAKQLILGTSLKGQAKPWWTYNLDLNWIHRTEDNVTPAIYDRIPPTAQSLPPATAYTDFKRTQFAAGSRFALHQNLALALNASVRKEDGSTVGTLAVVLPQSFNISRSTFLGTSALEYSTDRFTATAGLSFDKTEGFGEVTSPRVGLNWLTFRGGPRLKTSWAKGFKLPSFYSLGHPIVGNKSLRPERANSFDVGVEQEIVPSRVTVSATYFHNKFRDLVDFDSATFRLVNRSQSVIQGFEFGTDWKASAKFRFGVDFTYMVWEVTPNVQPLRNLPHGNGGIHLDWKPSARFRARAETQWMGRRYDYQVPAPNQETAGGYSNTNFSVEYDLDPKFTLYLRAENLFNAGYHEYIGFPNPGIAVRVGILFHSSPR